MRSLLLAGVLTLGIFTFALPVQAESKHGLWDMRVSSFSNFQQGGRTSFSGAISWDPSFSIANLNLRGEIGVGHAKGSALDKEVVLIPMAKAMWDLGLGDYSLEVGPGVQYWVNGSNALTLTGTVGVLRRFSSPVLLFDGIAADYTAVMLTNNLTHQVTIGLIF